MTVTLADIENALGPCSDVRRVGSKSGMGECWRVERSGETLACKVVLEGVDERRFEREVLAMSRLEHHRVVAVRGSGVMRVAGDATQRPYLLSQFIEGGDASSHGAVTSEAQLVAFLDGALEGLHAMHEARVIHRDIKPANIVLRDGAWADPVLIDLGLSRLPDVTSVTQYPWRGGTLPYMAPEQIRGRRATERSDVWALAVVAHELATGEHPFLTPGERVAHDWEARLLAGVPETGRYPVVDRWLRSAGQHAGYRRPDADGARLRLSEASS